LSNYGILIAVLIYEAVSIVGVGWWITQKARGVAESGNDFTHGGNGLPLAAVSLTMALTVLGAVHVLGVFEMTWSLGAAVVWFGIAHVVLLTIVCLGTGRWVRRLKLSTVPQFLEDAYGLETRLVVSCVMIGAMFGFLTLESQGLGILFYSMTGWDIRAGGVIGGLLGVAYVIFAGMKEVSWLNVINAILMYVALLTAVVFIAFALPGDGYQTAAEYYRETDQDFMTSIWGTPEILLVFAVPMTIAVVFSQATNQMLLQTTMSARSEKTIVRSLWIAAPVNGMFAVFAAILALAAKSWPEYGAMDGKVATTTMLVEVLPPWLAATLLASFVGVILSTFAMVSLASATLFSNDIYKRLYRPDATGAQQVRATRICIIILGLAATVLAMNMPQILKGVNWLLAWLVPIFWLFVFGLFWKRNQKVVMTALLVSWTLNSLWSFTSFPALVGMENVHNAYVTLIVSAVICVLGNLIFGGKPGFFKQTGDQNDEPAASQTI